MAWDIFIFLIIYLSFLCLSFILRSDWSTSGRQRWCSWYVGNFAFDLTLGISRKFYIWLVGWLVGFFNFKSVCDVIVLECNGRYCVCCEFRELHSKCLWCFSFVHLILIKFLNTRLFLIIVHISFIQKQIFVVWYFWHMICTTNSTPNESSIMYGCCCHDIAI